MEKKNKKTLKQPPAPSTSHLLEVGDIASTTCSRCLIGLSPKHCCKTPPKIATLVSASPHTCCLSQIWTSGPSCPTPAFYLIPAPSIKLTAEWRSGHGPHTHEPVNGPFCFVALSWFFELGLTRLVNLDRLFSLVLVFSSSKWYILVYYSCLKSLLQKCERSLKHVELWGREWITTQWW